MFSSVQSLSHARLIVTPWITAHQASLSITNAQSLLKLMPIESVMPSNHLTHCHPLSCLQSFQASRPFLTQFFTSDGQSIGVSTSAPVLPMNIQDWFPIGWTGWISLQSKGLSRVFSNTTVQAHHFFGAQLSHLYMITGKTIALTRWTFVGKEMTHWKRLWCWERVKAGGQGDDKGWDGWMASLTQWTWVWVNSGSW